MISIPHSPDSAMLFVQSHGYFLIFLVMVLEGPLITMAAAFAASMGIFSIQIIFLLSLLGDLVGDGIHYFIGHSTRRVVMEKYDLKFGLSKKRIKKLEKGLREHFGKYLFLIKFTPILTTPGLLLTGTMRVPIKKFIFYSFLITLPRTIFFTLTGYYLGVALSKVIRYTQIGGYVVLGVIIILVLKYLIVELNFKEVKNKIKKLFNH